MIMNDALRSVLHDIARKNESSYFVYCDALGNDIFDSFTDIDPKRIIACGISEANAMSIAAGLGLSGKKVYLCYTAIFWSTRAFEQLRDDIAYNNVDVTVIALQAGINSCNPKNGYSHWAIEDINNVRALPNIRILNPASVAQLESDLLEKGPVYIRIENHLSSFNPLALQDNTNKIKKIIDGESCVIIASGNFTEYAMKLLDSFKKLGVSPAIYNCSSLKPFDYASLEDIVKLKQPIITIENHGIGGLGTIVAEYLALKNCNCTFFPIRIDNDAVKFNIVGDLDYVIEKLFNMNYKITQVVDLCKSTKKSKFKIFSIDYLINKDYKIDRCYNLFGMPILKLVERNKIKKHKLKYKIFLFGKHRIL